MVSGLYSTRSAQGVKKQNGHAVNDARRTRAGRVCVDLVRLGCVKRDSFFPRIEDQGIIDRGLSVFINREKSEGDRPKRSSFNWFRVIVGIEERTKWSDCPFPQPVQTQGICLGERGFHPQLQ